MLGLDVVRAALLKLFLGASLPPSQHCRIPMLSVTWVLGVTDPGPALQTSQIFPVLGQGLAVEDRQGWVWKLFQGKSGAHGVRGRIMMVLCSPPCAWDCPGSHWVTRGMSKTLSVCRPGLSLQLVPLFADPS